MRSDEASALRDPQPRLHDGRPETGEADDRRCDDDRPELELDWCSSRPTIDDTMLSGWV